MHFKIGQRTRLSMSWQTPVIALFLLPTPKYPQKGSTRPRLRLSDMIQLSVDSIASHPEGVRQGQGSGPQ